MVARDLISVKNETDGASHFWMIFSLYTKSVPWYQTRASHRPYLLVLFCEIAAQVLLGIDN